jgi:hypothetical protein
LDRVAAGRLRDLADVTDHRHAEERQAVGPLVVVEHGDRHQAGSRAAQHLADGRGAGIAAADDRHAEAEALRAALPGEQSGVEADDAHAGGGEHAAHHHHERRDELDVDGVPGGPEGDQHTQGGGHRQEELAGLVGAGVPPHAAVESEHLVGDDGDDDGHRQELHEVEPVAAGCPVTEVGDLGQSVPGDHGDGVEQDEEERGTDAAGGHGHAAHVGARHVCLVGLPRVRTHVAF